MRLGKAIKLYREHRGLTLTLLAEKANRSTSYISLLEQDKRDPTISTIKAIAKSLNVPLTVLLFLGADKEELNSINPEIAGKLSLIALELIEDTS